MGTGYKNRGSGAAGLGFKNRGAKLVEGAAYTNRGATDGVNEAFKNRGQAWGSDAYYNRGPNDFASLSVLGLAAFYAPLTHSLILTRGTGDPTYTRATNAWEFDNEGKLILVPSGSARFGGARMVRNYLDKSEDFSDALWSAGGITPPTISANSAVAPDGNATADKISFENAKPIVRQIASLAGSDPVVIGEIYTFSCYVKAAPSNAATHIMLATNNTAAWNTGESKKIALTSEWQRVEVTWTQVTNTSQYLIIGAFDKTGTLDADCYGDVLVWGAQSENVTGQADQTASEYIPTGVLSAPYHGAGVDGVKWFATNKDGSAIPASSLLGYHAEGARTNSLLYSRDLTNAAWAATNITPAKTATGIDNAANSASTLTASAADATILQTLTLAAAARSFSAYVKRRTGSGSVYITRDGGTNWTDITAQINSTTWTRVKIENTSVLNPSVGFKIATSGDAIDVDVCQDEAGAFISSPIITTTAAVTRNADLLSYAAASNIDVTVGSIYLTARSDISSGYASNYNAAIIGLDTNLIMNRRANTDIRVSDGTNTNNLTVPSVFQRFAKAASSWSVTTSKMYCCVDATLSALTSFDGSLVSGTNMYIGNLSSGSSSAFNYTKNLYIWSTALTDAQLQQVTA